jgi:hypothetical protein
MLLCQIENARAGADGSCEADRGQGEAAVLDHATAPAQVRREGRLLYRPRRKARDESVSSHTLTEGVARHGGASEGLGSARVAFELRIGVCHF